MKKMKFKKVELNAFRVYKNKEDGTFDFTIDNGNKIANFVSIYAPNGFGKTSFYDGVEWAMTKNIQRFRNRSNDAKAERGEVQESEELFVLQHKDVSIETNRGHVKVETTIKNYSNSIRRNNTSAFNDYIFNMRSTTIENKFFQDVILSQDGIDSFLKVDNDKERYNKFINSFGDEKLAMYHENITKLEKKNKEELDKINAKIISIEEILKEPVDEQIFQFANEKINELKQFGINLEVIDSYFNNAKGISFEGALSEQKIELSGKIDSTNEELVNLSAWLENSSNYFTTKDGFCQTESKLKDYEDLFRSQTRIKFLTKEIQSNHLLKNKYEQLNTIYPIYKNIAEEVTAKEKELIEKIIEKDKDEKDHIQTTDEYSETLKQIELIESQKKQLTDLLQSAPEVYREILERVNKLQGSKSNLDVQKKVIEQYQANIKLLNNNKDKFKLIIESIENNIFRDIDSSIEYDLIVKSIELLIQENKFKQEELNVAINKQEQYEQYSAEVGNLLSWGISIIDENKTDICPLCNEKHVSYQILKDRILNNRLLDNIEKELLEQTEQLKQEIKRNEDRINVLKNSIISEYNKKVQEIESELSLLYLKTKEINLDSLQEDVNDQETSLFSLFKKTENKSEDDFIASKIKDIDELSDQLTISYGQKKGLEKLLNDLKVSMELNNLSIDNINKNISGLKEKEEYKIISTFAQQFDSNTEIKLKLDELMKSNNNLITENFVNLDNENKLSEKLLSKYHLINIADIQNNIQELKDISSSISSEILKFEYSYENYFNCKVINFERVKYDVEVKRTEIEKKLTNNKKCIDLINTLDENLSHLLKFIESKNKQKELLAFISERKKKSIVSDKILTEKKRLEKKINKDVESFFHEELINQIYSKIDPHPDYKKVSFKCSFENGVGKLNVFVTGENDDKPLSPSLYYSTAQLNVLSLSIFLAKALHAKDDKGHPVDCIFIDDPIQAMDSINILSTIDLLRSLVANYKKQIILSTHDENFHRLLEKKIPPEYFDSKFIELETFGKVKIEPKSRIIESSKGDLNESRD